MPLVPGQVLQERYHVQAQLHQGGMGAIYRAFDDALNCTVAIKEHIPDSRASAEALAQARLQFKREAQVLASLSHPNLPRVTNFFSWNSNEYLVMDFVEGQSLEALQSQHGSISPETVLNWTEQLLDALIYIHSANVIHRDIKPGNILLKKNGLVVLVDFGLVKLIDPGDPRTLLALRGIGTPEYAPPEQYSGEMAHTDARSDIYSLGATLYHLLTGTPPLPVLKRIPAPNAQPRPRSLNPNIPPELEAVVLKAIELHPEDRYQSAAQMRQSLKRPEARQVGGSETVLLKTQDEPSAPSIVPPPAPSSETAIVPPPISSSSSSAAVTVPSPASSETAIVPPPSASETVIVPPPATTSKPVSVPPPAIPTSLSPSPLAPYPSYIPAAVPKQDKRDRRWLVVLAVAGLVLILSVVAIVLYAVLNQNPSGSLAASNTRVTTTTTALVPALVPTPVDTLLPPPPRPGPETPIPIRAAETPTNAVSLPTAIPPPTPLPPISTPVPPPPSSPPPPPPSPVVPVVNGMVLIPGGDFWMGKVAADSSAAADENPGHTVFVSTFWIDQYEVSNGQYQACVTAGQCQKPAAIFSAQSPNAAYGKPGMEDFPVVTISDFMAGDYCRWQGKRLPFEAEWEKAARGPTEWIFPWGNQWDGARANAGKGAPGPDLVTAYPNGASPYGVMNMAGNVAEWIGDNYSSTWYRDSMTNNLLRDPAYWRETAPFNVRGGSFRSPVGDARISKRSSAKGDSAQMNDVGFRCVKEAR